MRQSIDATQIVPNVAKSWEVSPDGKIFTFKLRPGMKWSDGEPFGADDFVFFYQDFLGAKELAPSFPQWLRSGGKPSTLEKMDDSTFRIKFEIPNGILMMMLAYGDALPITRYPAHYLKQWHIKYADKAKLDRGDQGRQGGAVVPAL